MFPQIFEAAITASHEAVRAMATGDPGPTLALWSGSDDVVLANPLGPPIVGHEKVGIETTRVAAMFSGLESFSFQEIVRFETNDLGYLLGFEHAQVKRLGSDAINTMNLRVTTIFRHDQDGWKLVLRHADRVAASL